MLPNIRAMNGSTNNLILSTEMNLPICLSGHTIVSISLNILLSEHTSIRFLKKIVCRQINCFPLGCSGSHGFLSVCLSSSDTRAMKIELPGFKSICVST